jgi:hypothetical protein
MKKILGIILLLAFVPVVQAGEELKWKARHSGIEDMQPFSDGLAAVRIDDKWGFVDRGGKLVIEPRFHESAAFVNGLAAVETGEGYGYLRKDGSWQISPRYWVGFAFGQKAALVTRPDMQEALIDRDGHELYVFAPDLEPHGDFVQGLLHVTQHFPQVLRNVDGRSLELPLGTFLAAGTDGWRAGLIGAGKLIREERTTRYGYLNQKGEWAIPPKFSEVSTFRDGVALVRESEDLAGLIDTHGEWVVRFGKELSAQRDSSGLYLAQGRAGAEVMRILDARGRVLLESPCAHPAYQEPGLDWTLISGEACQETTILQASGTMVVLPMIAAGIDSHSNHQRYLIKGRRAAAGSGSDDADDEVYVIIDRQGKVLLDSQKLPVKGKLSEFGMFGDNPATGAGSAMPMAYYGDSEGIHLVTIQGKTVGNQEWQSHTFFDYAIYRDKIEGPLTVETPRGWGALDAEGRWQVEPQYSAMQPFRFGLAAVQMNDGEFLIDLQGRRYDYPAGRNFSVVAPLTLAGYDPEDHGILVDLATGTSTRIPGDDSDIPQFRNGLASLREKEKWGLIDTHANWVAQPEYEDEPTPLEDARGKLAGWKVGHAARTSHGDAVYGMLSADGTKRVLPVRYADVVMDANGLLRAAPDVFTTQVFDLQGREIGLGARDSVNVLGDGWMAAQSREALGFMNESGEWVLKPVVMAGNDTYFREETAFIHMNIDGEEVFIDPQGRISRRGQPLPHTLPDTPENWYPVWDSEENVTTWFGFDWKPRLSLGGAGEPFADGVAILQRFNPDVTGLIDSKGQFLLTPRVGGAQVREQSMHEGLGVFSQAQPAPAGKKKAGAEPRLRFGYVSAQGRIAIPARFDAAQPFSEGRAGVVADGNIGIIDDKGRVILQGGWHCDGPALVDASRKLVWTSKPGCRQPVSTRQLRTPSDDCGCGKD